MGADTTRATLWHSPWYQQNNKCSKADDTGCNKSNNTHQQCKISHIHPCVQNHHLSWLPDVLLPSYMFPGGHIPYRDSKLTRILQPSLGGNAKTAIICNITPAACHVEESHSTLRFACRAKRVVNNAVVNEVLSDAAVLKRQAKEIEELRKALAASGCVEYWQWHQGVRTSGNSHPAADQ